MSYWNGTQWERGEPASPQRARPSRRRHAVEALTEGLLIALLTVGLVAGTAFAAKGGNANQGSGTKGGGKTAGGTISLLVLDGSDGVANYMERVGFDVSTSATDRPFVGLRCYQGTDFVLDGYTGYFDSYMFDPWITLGSPYWQPDRSADCTARLFYYDNRGREKVQATKSFTVAP